MFDLTTMFSVTKLKELIILMGRVYDTTHNLFVGVSILLIWGGLFAFFTQSRYTTGFMGVDPQKHGRGMGITMFFTEVTIATVTTTTVVIIGTTETEAITEITITETM